MLIMLRSIFLSSHVMEAPSTYIENLCNIVWACNSGILHERICFEKLTSSHSTFTSKHVVVRIEFLSLSIQIAKWKFNLEKNMYDCAILCFRNLHYFNRKIKKGNNSIYKEKMLFLKIIYSYHLCFIPLYDQWIKCFHFFIIKKDNKISMFFLVRKP